jgi:tetratricopeptide (TPR) repeat protein
LVMAVMRPGPASQRRVAPLLLAALWSVLLATGFWSTRIYAEYNGILQDVFNTEISSYREGAVRLQSVVDADPGMALYHNQQGYLFALAAAQGDESTLQCAIDAYTHFVDFEPFNATGWANLGVLTVQAGDVSAGVEALREAVRLAPSSWPIVFNLAAVVEESGETALARDLYLRALDGTSHLDPVWQATPLRREIAAEAAPAREAVVVAALMGDDPVDVEAVWSASGLVADERTRTVVLRLLLERKAGRDDAERWLSVAEDRMTDDEDRAWLALARGDYDAALDYVQPDVTTSEWVFGVNIPYFQFLRYAVPRQFVPQLYYPAAHPALLLLLGEQPVPLSQAGN